MKNFNLTKLHNRGITAARGFKTAGIASGIKNGKKDLAVIYSQTDAVAAAVFTQNKVKAAPVILCQEHINMPIRGVVINSGNANACTGKQGRNDAESMAVNLAGMLKTEAEQIMVCSTGVIGFPMPMDKVVAGISKIVSFLSEGPGADTSAAEAILTTDTKVKLSAYRCSLPEGEFHVAGMAKGSGMICPNMATMLAFLTTDVKIERDILQNIFSESADRTFNSITVDGDTSTNDTAMILANGAAEGVEVTEGSPFYGPFVEMVEMVCRDLALKIVEDGEGITKILSLNIRGALNVKDARTMARTILNSPLVKTAFYGEDANWGRIIAALGYAGVDFNPELVDIYIGPYQVAKEGGSLPFDEVEMKNVLKEKKIEVIIDLNLGQAETKFWGTDLSHEYISINSSYRS